MAQGLGGASAANVTHNLQGIHFPARKEELLEHARKNNAEKAVLDALGKMPEQDYKTMADVMRALGKIH